MGIIITMLVSAMIVLLEAPPGGLEVNDLATNKLENGIGEPVFWDIFLLGIIGTVALGGVGQIADNAVDVSSGIAIPAIAGKIFTTLAATSYKVTGPPLAAVTVNRGWNRVRNENASMRNALESAKKQRKAATKQARISANQARKQSKPRQPSA
ncbi:MAG: hypothetical protein AAFY76_21765 [Cyanobacteria bacterium J06649_11]